MYRLILRKLAINRRNICVAFSIQLTLIIIHIALSSRKPTRLDLVRWKPGVHDLEFDNIKMVCINRGNQQIIVNEMRDYLPSGRDGLPDMKDKYSTLHEILEIVKFIGTQSKTVLVSVINNSYTPFLYSWLCNTKDLSIHKSVLVISTDIETVHILRRDWPEVNAVAVALKVPGGNQGYSRAGYIKILVERAKLILEILKIGVNVMLTEFDYVWFANPVPELERMTEADILINPVSLSRRHIFNGGLIYTFSTEKSIRLWQQLVSMMIELGEKLEAMPDDAEVTEIENDQQFFSKLIRQRYADIRTRDLPLETYADGWWYIMTESERNKTHPVMISNNFIEGNVNKMKRAIEWGHWFLQTTCKCNMEQVRKILIDVGQNNNKIV